MFDRGKLLASKLSQFYCATALYTVYLYLLAHTILKSSLIYNYQEVLAVLPTNKHVSVGKGEENQHNLLQPSEQRGKKNTNKKKRPVHKKSLNLHTTKL